MLCECKYAAVGVRPTFHGQVLAGAICLLAVVGSSVTGAEWQVGVAGTVITPQVPVHLVGYGGRATPFTDVETDIYAKALAFADQQGNRGIIVTADLVGFPDVFFASVCERVMQKTGLTRSQIMLNASHNHTGPLMSLKPDLNGNLAYSAFSDGEAQRVVDYTRWLQDEIVRLMLAALDDMKPAVLSWGTDQVTFMKNRRVRGSDGRIRMAPNADGPVDQVVPVLIVRGEDNALRALLFGCACHNTGLTGDHNIITGDYAGYAQEILEQKYPGVVALFKSGCGADANPEPRSDVVGVRRHGQELADAVSRVIDGTPRSIGAGLRCEYRLTDLPFLELNRDQLKNYHGTVGLMTEHMLSLLDAGKTLRKKQTVPVAAWSFGDELKLVAFPSETVAEYALNLRAEFPEEPLWVSAYNNDFFGYIPTAQMTQEGGHETIGVTTWLWGTDLADYAGLFHPDVEEILMNSARELIQRLQQPVTVVESE